MNSANCGVERHSCGSRRPGCPAGEARLPSAIAKLKVVQVLDCCCCGFGGIRADPWLALSPRKLTAPTPRSHDRLTSDLDAKLPILSSRQRRCRGSRRLTAGQNGGNQLSPCGSIFCP